MSRNGRQRSSHVTPEGSFYARIAKQRGGGYLVEFPDLPACLTEGDSMKAARANAREALSAWLFVALEHDDEIPLSRVRRGRDYHVILPDLDVRVPLAIRTGRRRHGLTREQVASALGVTAQAYRRLESPGKSNPTLRTLDRLAEILGIELHLKAA